MAKILTSLFFIFTTHIVFAESYSGLGIGLSEACRTKYQPSFFDGDCISPNMTVHGLMGNQVSDYFSIESTVDFSFDTGNVLDLILDTNSEDSFFYDPDVESDRWSILTVAIHPLLHLPLSNSVGLFVGPSFGGSMVNFAYEVEYFGSDYRGEQSGLEFGLNYGWTAGMDLNKSANGAIRLQWQNWRSLDADVAVDNEFNSNTFTVSMISYF